LTDVLSWSREWGKHIDKLTDLAESGVSVKALENRPVLLPGLDVFLKAYDDLTYDRPVGFGVGSIPWSSIIKWCQLNGMHDINDMDSCIRYIRKLEQVDHEITERKKGATNG